MPHIVLSRDGSAEDYFLSRRVSDDLTIEIRQEGDVLPRAELSGFRLEQFCYCSFAAVGFPKSIIYKRRPYLAHTLIAVASLA